MREVDKGKKKSLRQRPAVNKPILVQKSMRQRRPIKKVKQYLSNVLWPVIDCCIMDHRFVRYFNYYYYYYYYHSSSCKVNPRRLRKANTQINLTQEEDSDQEEVSEEEEIDHDEESYEKVSGQLVITTGVVIVCIIICPSYFPSSSSSHKVHPKKIKFTEGEESDQEEVSEEETNDHDKESDDEVSCISVKKLYNMLCH